MEKLLRSIKIYGPVHKSINKYGKKNGFHIFLWKPPYFLMDTSIFFYGYIHIFYGYIQGWAIVINLVINYNFREFRKKSL